MKKVFAIILCLCLCLTLLPAFALTASAAPAATIYINGQSLSIGSSISVNGGYAATEYNGGTDTLIITLDNCAIGSTTTVSSTAYGFYVKTDITNVMVKLNGENTCESNFRIQGDADYLNGTTNILSGSSGDGSLTVNGKFSVEHGDVYIDACELEITGQNTNGAFAAYINNSLTLGTPAVKGGTFSEPYVTLETERNIGMWVNGPLTVNSGNSTFTGRYYGLFIKDSGYEPIFNVAGGYTACNGNQAGILLMFNRDYGVDPVTFKNGCGEFNFGRLDCRENFDFGDGYKNAKFFSWMKPEWTDPLIVNGTSDDVFTGTLSCNAMTSMYFRQMDKVYVTFDAGEFGELAGGVSKTVYALPYGEKIGVMPIPVNKTFHEGKFNNLYFSGWCIDEPDLWDMVDDNYCPTQNITLHAYWMEGQGTPFKDVKDSDWFKDAASYCSCAGLIAGTGDGKTFSPYTVCTRSMVVSILYRLSGEPAVWQSNPFSDVKNDFWYTDAIVWAAENGIVAGIGGGKFAPNDSITREQLASIMERYAKFCGQRDPDCHVQLAGFPDADKVSSWAGNGVSWAVSAGLISGKTNGGQTLLDPKGTATRAEFASIMLRYVKLTDGARTFFIGELFRITVPELWQGNVVCETGTADIGDWINLYCKAENELSGNGRLCDIIFTEGYDYFDLPHWEFRGVMLDESFKLAYNIIFDLPTDVQANEDPDSPLATRYFSMFDMLYDITFESDWYTFSEGVG